ncbi:MAG: ribose-phosphate diphosphokinase [Candidatus Altarchaeaceae archaeon]
MEVFDFEYNAGKILESKDLGVKSHGINDIIIKKFPDEEIYVRVLPDVENKKCVLIKSIYNNEELIKTFLILNALKKGGAKKIYLFATYLTYLRQDKIFKKGECLSAEFVLSELKNYSDEIFLLNPHIPFNFYGKTNYKGIEFYGIDMSYEIAKHFVPTCKEAIVKLENPKVIAPDEGAINLAKRYSEILMCDFAYLSKTRISGTEVVVEEKNLGIENKDVLIVDDIISTGGTLIKNIEIIKKQNPKSINIACVHGVFCDEEKLKKLKEISNSIVATNSIHNGKYSEIKKIDVSKVVADALIEYVEF